MTTSASSAPSTTQSIAPPVKVNGGVPEPTLVVRLVALDSLRESKTNPRKSKNTEADAELVASVRQHGVLQPVIARPLGETGLYELVAGSRRFSAAKAAGLKALPARILKLTDEQALEIQIIENLQREDVQPIEEGRGYRELIEMRLKASGIPRNAMGSRQTIIADVAREVGKSKRYVYARMKLAELTPELQKLLEEGRITASHGDLLVMLEPAQQKEVLKEFGRQRYHDDEVMSVRDLAHWIETEVQHDLSAAAWKKDDPTLLPAAGRCNDCSKRTGFDPGLHPAVKKGRDLCLDPGCYESKRQAFVKIQLASAASAHVAALNKDGDAEQAKKIAAKIKTAKISPESSEYNSKLEGAAKKDVLFAGYGHDRSFALLKTPDECGHAQPAVFVEGPETGHAVTICKDHGCEKHFKKDSYGDSVARGRSALDPYRQKQLLAERKRKLEMEARQKALGLAMTKSFKPGLEDLRAIAQDFFALIGHDRETWLGRALNWPKPTEAYAGYSNIGKKKIAEMNEAQLGAFLMCCAASDELGYGSYETSHPCAYLTSICKRAKVDLERVRDGVKLAKDRKTVQTAARKPQSAVSNRPSAKSKAKKKAGRK